MNHLYVGYARASLVPEIPVPLAGYGNTEKRLSANVLDPIYVTCIAMTQGPDTVLLMTQDMLWCNKAWTGEIRKIICEQTGIPPERVLLSSTHTHSAPDILISLPVMEEYKPQYISAVTTAAQEALKDRAPAEIYGTKTKTEKMNFVRHYRLANGTVAGANFGDYSSAPIAGHVRSSDPQMLLTKFAREGKPDILLVNWQAHLCMTGGEKATNVSADFVAPLRDTLEARTGMLTAYFTGAAGDLVTGSRIKEEDHGLRRMAYGEKLAQAAIDALTGLQKLSGTVLDSLQIKMEYPHNHEGEEHAAEAEEVVKLWRSEGTAAGNKLAREKGFSSVYHAGSILRRMKRSPGGCLELNAFRVGELAFVTAPYEMFCAHGEYIKSHSPFPITVVCTCANEYCGYLPTEEAFAYDCYEACQSIFARGAGEAAAERLVEMLNRIHS